MIGGDGCFSGVPKYIDQLMRALQGQARISVMSDTNRGGYDFVAEQGGTLHEIAGLKTTLSPFRALNALRNLRRALRGGEFDRVWAHSRMSVLLLRAAMLGLSRKQRGQIPQVIVTYHGLPFDAGHRQPFATLSKWFERIFLRLTPSHHLCFLSNGAQQRFQHAIGADICKRHKCIAIMNCSDLGPLPALDKPANERVIVMTGRAGYQKNLGKAAQLFARLPDHYRLVLCGSGTDRPEKRAMFAQHITADALGRVAFVGPVADIRPYLAQADLYLMTSRYEGMPIGAIEAFEAGLPAALSQIEGTRELLATHPMAAALPLQDLSQDAARIDELTTTYLSDRGANTAAIHAAWAQSHSFAHWKRQILEFWQTLDTEKTP